MTFAADAHAVVDRLSQYLELSHARDGKVIDQEPLAALADRFEVDNLIARGGLTGPRLERFLEEYLAATTRLHHPGYFAHQVAVPEPNGALGSLIDGLTNNAMAVYEMGPAAAMLEFVLLNWMLRKVGWKPAPLPPTRPDPGSCGGGLLTHGGSLANLTALAAARARVNPEAWEEGVRQDLVVIAPAVAHYSIARAVGILGLGQKALVDAPTDADGRMLPKALPQLVRTVRARGKTVLAVVANACSTAVGLYDPLREVGDFCRDQDLWLHVDGAHGASALLSATLKSRLDGVELADSLVWDAHKMLRAPTLCAAVLVRDHRDLDGAFRQRASYLFHAKDEPGFDFMGRSVECTKAGLGLRLFMGLASTGEAALGRYVERQTALAKEVAARMRREPGVEVAVEPESNIVCFRVAGDDTTQLELRRRLLADGRSYLSSTEFRGQRWLRLALMNPLTEMGDVELLLETLRGRGDAR